jgi:hypothetical protein
MLRLFFYAWQTILILSNGGFASLKLFLYHWHSQWIHNIKKTGGLDTACFLCQNPAQSAMAFTNISMFVNTAAQIGELGRPD